MDCDQGEGNQICPSHPFALGEGMALADGEDERVLDKAVEDQIGIRRTHNIDAELHLAPRH